MARPLRIEYPGAFHHVTSRGNEQKDVFKSQKDRERFLSYVESAVVRYGAVVHTWCLMKQPLSPAAGNTIGQHFANHEAHQWYIHDVFQRQTRASRPSVPGQVPGNPGRGRCLCRGTFPHLNPVRAGMVAKPEHYQWLSYQSYIGQCTTPGG